METAEKPEEKREPEGVQNGAPVEEADYKSKYLYLLAEMDNYRKARDREITEWSRFASEKLMKEMLKVLDDFESAMKADKDQRIEALFRSFYSVLSSNGLERMEVIGKEYSPDIAEAVTTEKLEGKTGRITEEVQAGYTLNGRVIRYPKVKVSI